MSQKFKVQKVFEPFIKKQSRIRQLTNNGFELIRSI